MRLHILHHAGQRPVHDQWMIDELAGHGCRLPPGTPCQILSKFERDGYLTCRTACEGRRSRKFYTITHKGREGPALARVRLREPERKDQAE